MNVATSSESLPKPETRRSKNPKYIVRRALAATALTATVLAAPKAAEIVDNLHTSQTEALAQKEAEVIEKMRGGEEESRVSNKVYILHSGVKYRSTPNSINEDLGQSGTVAGIVPEGKDLVVTRPIIHYDHVGKSWSGFRFQSSEGQEAPNEVKSPSEIAEAIYWVDTDTLSGQKDENGMPYSEVVLPGDVDEKGLTPIARIGEDGSITLEDGRHVAQGELVSSSEAPAHLADKDRVDAGVEFAP